MVRINVVFSKEVLEEIDRIAEEEGKSRSLLLREAAERVVEERKKAREEVRRKARRRQSAAVMDRLREKSSADWDGTAIVRKWRDARK